MILQPTPPTSRPPEATARDQARRPAAAEPTSDDLFAPYLEAEAGPDPRSESRTTASRPPAPAAKARDAETAEADPTLLEGAVPAALPAMPSQETGAPPVTDFDGIVSRAPERSAIASSPFGSGAQPGSQEGTDPATTIAGPRAATAAAPPIASAGGGALAPDAPAEVGTPSLPKPLAEERTSGGEARASGAAPPPALDAEGDVQSRLDRLLGSSRQPAGAEAHPAAATAPPTHAGVGATHPVPVAPAVPATPSPATREAPVVSATTLDAAAPEVAAASANSENGDATADSESGRREPNPTASPTKPIPTTTSTTTSTAPPAVPAPVDGISRVEPTSSSTGSETLSDAPSPPSGARPAAGATPGVRPSATQGPRPDVNAAALDRIHDQIRMRLRPHRPEISIRLDPPELGRLLVRLEMRGGALAARVDVERPEIARAFEGDVSRLARTLEEAGLRVAEIDIRTQLDGDGSRTPSEDPWARAREEADHERGHPGRDGRPSRTAPSIVATASALDAESRATVSRQGLDVLI